MTIKNARVLAVIAKGPQRVGATMSVLRTETPQEFATRCVLVAAEACATLPTDDSCSNLRRQIRASFGLGEKP